MTRKVVVLKGKGDSGDEQTERRKAIQLSHSWLERLEDDEVSPQRLIMALAHTMGHVLMACPNEDLMKGALVHFMEEVDFKSLVEAWREREDTDEDNLGEPASSSIN